MRFGELISKIKYRFGTFFALDGLDGEVDRVTTDPYRADARSLMICVRTAVLDGHDFATVAYERGCRLFLAERSLALGEKASVLLVEDAASLAGELAAACYGYPATRMTVVGVTGTAGKSSVIEIAASILRQSGRKVGTLTTDGVSHGDRVVAFGNIVPDAAEVQRILSDMEADGVTVAVLEFSAYMLAQKAYLSIPFAALLLTNLQENGPEAHRHGGADQYRARKASLFEKGASFYVLPANFVGFVPDDDSTHVLRFGDGSDFCGEMRAVLTCEHGYCTDAELMLGDGVKRRITLPVLGDFALENALAAAALCRAIGATAEEIAKGLASATPGGRLACLAAFRGRYIYEDTAYTAEALTLALQTLRTVTTGKLTVLLGSVGGRTRARRAPLGKAATMWADLAYFTADNADFEDPAAICAEMAAEADPDRYVVLPDPVYAIKRAVLEMRPGDTLLIAGKGGELHQLVGGERREFLVRELVRRALLLL